MRIVRGPHEFVLAEEPFETQPDLVFLIGDPDLVAEELARQHHVATAPGLAFEMPPVPEIQLLDEPRYPAAARLGEHDLKPRMPAQDAEGEQTHERFVEHLCRLEAQVELRGSPRSPDIVFAVGVETVRPGSRAEATDATDMVGDQHTCIRSRGPETVPLRLVHLRVHGPDEKTYLAHAVLRHAQKLCRRILRTVRKHLRDRKQPLRRRARELRSPVVIGGDYSASDTAIRGLHLQDGRKVDRKIHVLAIHVRDAQLRRRRPQHPVVRDPATVERGHDAFALEARKPVSAAPFAPASPLADPVLVSTAPVDHVRRAVLQL